ncbi:MAG TPA: hypothetical protein VHK91_16645, partial [Flavisolibacter sp.]|nr:hypothetical protein [Flavisolibacter sp.]
MATISNLYQGVNSQLSFQPLIKVLRRMIAEGKPGARKLYQGLLDEIDQLPELQQPIEDRTILSQHTVLVETLLSTIFPPATAANQGIYAICFPFQSEAIYSSPEFKALFLKEGSDIIDLPDHKTNINIAKANVSLAYNLILRKFYSHEAATIETSVHPYTDPASGLTRYFELRLNAQFIDVKCIDKDYALPAGFSPNRTIELDELKTLFPLEHFQFDGVIVIDVTDVTQEQVINEIKNALLNINAFSDTEVYEELQQHVQSLIGIQKVKIGVTPFFKKNEYYLYTEAHYKHSLLFRNDTVTQDKDKISEQCQEVFRHNSKPILYEILNESSSRFNELLKYYYEQGAQSLILCPLLLDNGSLIGLLEIASEQKGKLKFEHLSRVQPAIPLFTLTLEKMGESLDMQIDKTIKEHFTAIQPAVEWKFT